MRQEGEDVCEVQNSVLPVLLGAAGGEGGETSHEEVETGEGDEVDSELSEVGVELTGEAEAASNTGEGS